MGVPTYALLRRLTAQTPLPLRLADGSWTRSDAEKGAAFAKHLKKVLLPHLPEMELRLPKTSVATPKRSFSFRAKRVAQVFSEEVDPKKAREYDLCLGNFTVLRFGSRFLEKRGTMEQVHRIVSCIKSALENRKYCSAAFFDVA